MKKLIIAGGTGFIGNVLLKYFQEEYLIIVLTRKHKIDTKKVKYIKWKGDRIFADYSIFENSQALINLCGKNVNCRYNYKNQEKIYDSRILSCLTLGRLINELKYPPKVWINTVSSTIYQHSESVPQTEFHHTYGHGFSVDVCHKWEGTINNIKVPETRKVLVRTSIVLGKEGGALQPILKAAKFGLGGKQGKGNQMISWIHENDLARMIHFLIKDTRLTGEFNAACNNPVRNDSFMKHLRAVWNIPIGIPLPKWILYAVQFLVGTNSELMLKSRYVLPVKLLNEGFKFDFDKLSDALIEIKSRRITKQNPINAWG